MILKSFLSKRKKYGEKKYRMEDVTMKKDKEVTRTGSYEKTFLNVHRVHGFISVPTLKRYFSITGGRTEGRGYIYTILI